MSEFEPNGEFLKELADSRIVKRDRRCDAVIIQQYAINDLLFIAKWKSSVEARNDVRRYAGYIIEMSNTLTEASASSSAFYCRDRQHVITSHTRCEYRNANNGTSRDCDNVNPGRQRPARIDKCYK